MSEPDLSLSLDDLEFSVRAQGLLDSLGIRTVRQLVECPKIVIPADWPAKIARLVAQEIVEVCEELGTSYEGELVVPPLPEAELRAEGTVEERWATIRGWLEAEHPEALEYFRPAAAAEDIAAAEAALGVTFPADYRAFLALHDGQEEFAPMVGLGPLLPISEVAEAHAEISADETEVDEDLVGEGVRAVEYSSGWIPISRSARGRDYLCLDLDPAPGGTVGQVIEYVADEDARPLVAKSFADLLSLFFEQAQTGELDLTGGLDDDDYDDIDD